MTSSHTPPDGDDTLLRPPQGAPLAPDGEGDDRTVRMPSAAADAAAPGLPDGG